MRDFIKKIRESAEDPRTVDLSEEGSPGEIKALEYTDTALGPLYADIQGNPSARWLWSSRMAAICPIARIEKTDFY